MIYQQTTSKQTCCPFDLLLSVIHSFIPKHNQPFCFLYQHTVLALPHYESGSHNKVLHNKDYFMVILKPYFIPPSICKLLHIFLIINFQQTNKASLKNKAQKVCIKTNTGTSQSKVGNYLLLGRQTELFWWCYRGRDPHDLIFCVTHFCSDQTIM
jgi:hypothetical protein